MARFLVLYRTPVSVPAQMQSSTPEQRQADLEPWHAWAAKARSAIDDLGSPLGDGAVVDDGEAYNDIAGFSILENDSQQAVVDLLSDDRTSTRRRPDRGARAAAHADALKHQQGDGVAANSKR